MSISINNVVAVSISEAPGGIANYRINNLALFTSESPLSPFTPGYAVYTDSDTVEADFGYDTETAAMARAIFAQSPNILAGDGVLIVCPIETSLEESVADLSTKIFFGGAISNIDPTFAQLQAIGSTCAEIGAMFFCGSTNVASVQTSGKFVSVKDANLHNIRCILYTSDIGGTGTGNTLSAQTCAAAYASRGMSVDFDGSNTALTMHLKDLVGLAGDQNITSTVLEECRVAGADCYVPIAGTSKVYCSGENEFFDTVYNLIWLRFALQVAGFNALATTNTKLPQTETGMVTLKGAYIRVLLQAIANGIVAPGSWTSSFWFGNQQDMARNISSVGYYIYSKPVTQQNVADRAARKAPLVQIGIKLAGAIHSSDVYVYYNA